MTLHLLGASSQSEGTALREQVRQFTDQLVVHWPRDIVGFPPAETLNLMGLTSQIYTQVLAVYQDMLEDNRFRLASGSLEQIERILSQLNRKADAVHFNARIRQLKAARDAGTAFVQIPGFRDEMIAFLLEAGSAMDAAVILNQNVAPDLLVKAALAMAAPGAGWYAIFDDIASKWNAFVGKVEGAADGTTAAAEALQRQLPRLPDGASIDRRLRIAAVVGGVIGTGILGTLVYMAVKKRKA
jgi:hypothetical protein